VRHSRRSVALGWALFICSGFASTVAAALATETFGEVSPATGSGFSFTVAGILVLTCRRPPAAAWRGARVRASAALGLIALVNVIVLYLALDRLPLGTAITIEFLGPLGLALAHASKWRDYLAAVFAVAGVALVTGAAISTDALGIALALGAALCWALYILASRRAGSFASPADSLIVAISIGGLAALPLAVIAGFQIGAVGVLALLVGVAVTGRIMPYAFEIFALRLMPPGSAGVLFSVVPVIAVAVGFVVLDEPYSSPQIIGLIAVVAGSAMVLRDASPASKDGG
jgi:inner membrane transporter RhtA